MNWSTLIHSSRVQGTLKTSNLIRWRIFPLVICVTVASFANAQTNKVDAMRELRMACLESFNTTHERLEELHSFVEQQTERQRSAADQLFQLQQSAASARRRIAELEQKQTNVTVEFSQAEEGIDRAVASYKAAGKNLPSGESWAEDGSKALAELRRDADANPRDKWRHERVKNIESEFTATVHDWRAARRQFERAGFDLDLRTAPITFKGISNQLSAASAELKSLGTLIGERESALSLLATNSEAWAKTIRELNHGNAEASKRLAKVASDFHLVDLKFTAWRLNQAGLAGEGISTLPDVLERQTAGEFSLEKPRNAPIMAGNAASFGESAMAAPSASGAASEKENAEQEPSETDAHFRELLERVNLANGRLQFLLEAWNAESTSVQSAIEAVEGCDEKAKGLVDETASLAADLESLRRSTESAKVNLTAGLATIDLVQKRYGSDIQEINHLLDDAARRTTELQKRLEQQ